MQPMPAANSPARGRRKKKGPGGAPKDRVVPKGAVRRGLDADDIAIDELLHDGPRCVAAGRRWQGGGGRCVRAGMDGRHSGTVMAGDRAFAALYVDAGDLWQSERQRGETEIHTPLHALPQVARCLATSGL